MTLEDFLARAHELGEDGVSLESCYMNQDPGYLREVRAKLDGYGLERVVGLGPSRRPGRRRRVAGSSRNFPNEAHGPQITAGVR
jgi:hypothetical protein